jgi:hypothetical protein
MNNPSERNSEESECEEGNEHALYTAVKMYIHTMVPIEILFITFRPACSEFCWKGTRKRRKWQSKQSITSNIRHAYCPEYRASLGRAVITWLI